MSSIGIVTEAEVRTLPSRHPTRRLAYSDVVELTTMNTLLAGKAVSAKNPAWLSSLKGRLLDATDFTNASGALGELRAYGALIETWMPVDPAPEVPGKKVRPEFAVEAGDGTVIIEVHSRQLAGNEARALESSLKRLQTDHAEQVRLASLKGEPQVVVTSEAIPIHPFGAPLPGKPGDTVETNAISKIASVKGSEHQIDASKPFVLWLDLQDPEVWGVPISDDHFSPAFSLGQEGEVAPGTFWWALYGRKGDLLPQSRGYSYGSIPLAHEGRFFQSKGKKLSQVAAYVFSLPRATVLMENPAAAVPVTPRFRGAMLKAPHFRLDLSLLNWESGTVGSLVEEQRRSVSAAVRALGNFRLD